MTRRGPRRVVPIAYTDTLAWRKHAACSDQGNTPVEIKRWFPGPGGDQERGKSICSICPVTTHCKSYADSLGIEDGIWGGEIRTSD